VTVFSLGVLMIKLADGPLNDAITMFPPLGPAPIAIGQWLELCNAAGMLLAPAYFAVAVYVLLSY